MKKFFGSLGMLAATMILAVSAVAQQEVAPDHFDASPASAQQRKASQIKKSVRPAQTGGVPWTLALIDAKAEGDSHTWPSTGRSR